MVGVVDDSRGEFHALSEQASGLMLLPFHHLLLLLLIYLFISLFSLYFLSLFISTFLRLTSSLRRLRAVCAHPIHDRIGSF